MAFIVKKTAPPGQAYRVITRLVIFPPAGCEGIQKRLYCCIFERNRKNEELKEMANENDIVLIYLEDQPLSFARIEDILADSKPDWYHVKLLLLQVPLQVVTWILRDIYINGEEFTMNSKRMRLEKIEVPAAESPQDKPEDDRPPGKSADKGNVISLQDMKR